MQTVKESRSIRELINTREFRPVGRGAAGRERRSSARFTCRLPAVLAARDKEFPVECLEISIRGARITSHRPLPLTVDQPVELRIRVGPQVFSDRYLVVRVSKNHHGPITAGLKIDQNEPSAYADA